MKKFELKNNSKSHTHSMGSKRHEGDKQTAMNHNDAGRAIITSRGPSLIIGNLDVKSTMVRNLIK